MAYRTLRKKGLPYNWKTQSEVIMDDENGHRHDSNHQANPQRPGMNPAQPPVPKKKPKLRHHKSMMAGVQGLISASASTVSLTATRLLRLKKTPVEQRMQGQATETQNSYPDLARSIISNNLSEETIVMDDAVEDPTAVVSIEEFRGGLTWARIDSRCRGLDLDLFCPYDKDDLFHTGEILEVQDMAPMSTFRNLRSLRLTGMLQSYQKEIWRTVWLNPQLEDLELGMALEPSLNDEVLSSWFSIHGGWEFKMKEGTMTKYFGDKGQGKLHEQFGIGEYLDKLAILDAKEAARKLGGRLHQLPVINLTLSGFVVDADPFFMWFNPNRLQSIKFKGQCVDAGFAVPMNMGHVTISKPGFPPGYCEDAEMIYPQEFKLVELKHGEPCVYWNETDVGRELQKIKKKLDIEAEQKGEEKSKGGKGMDKKGKGKEVEGRSHKEVQHMLDQVFRYEPSPPPLPRRRGPGFLSSASLPTLK